MGDGATPRRAAIVGLAADRLTADEVALFRDWPPLGVVLFRRNLPDGGGSPRGLADAVRTLLGPSTLVMIDQEGGRVARLRPPRFAAHAPAAALGLRHAHDPSGAERAAFLTGALIGHDCRDAGCDVVAAPVLDRAVPGADAVIGDRAFAAEPARIARLAGAVADGLLTAGCQPVGKHAPGHGRATADSHATLPMLDAIDEADLAPFRALAPRLGWMMTAHVLFRASDPDRPATLSASVLADVVRGRIGFDGVLVSDDLAMGALSGDVGAGTPSGDAGARAAAALAAGCDVALHCSGVLADTLAVLAASPPPGATARRRLDEARRLAASRAVPLDRAALLAERDALLR